MRRWALIAIAACACGDREKSAASGRSASGSAALSSSGSSGSSAVSSSGSAGSSGSSGSSAAASGAPDDPWAASAGSAITPDASAKVVVANRGREPRQLVRYTIGTVDREVAFAVTVEDDQPLGDMRYRWQCTPCKYQMTKFGSAGDPDAFAGIAKQISGKVAIAPSGELTIDTPFLMKTTPSTPDMFDLAVVRFPDEAIGVGARWTVTKGTSSNAFTLVSVTKDAARVEVSGLQTSTGGLTAVAHLTGVLDVSLVDPVAKGTIEIKIAMGGDPNIGMDGHEMKQTLVIR